MKIMDYKNILKEITKICSVSGFEKEYSKFLNSKIDKLCDEVEIDLFNNVIGKKNINLFNEKNKLKIMLSAHLDEVGLMVTKIEDNGFIRFTNIGAVDPKILLAQEVIIHGKEKIFGIIGAKPPHLIQKSEQENVMDFNKLYIDTGYKKNDLENKISIGSIITFNDNFISLKNNHISTKALDNKAGICIILGVMDELKKYKFENYTVFNFTSMEETHNCGIINSCYKLNIDLAIIVDACHGTMQGVSEDNTYTVGGGPVISIGPSFSGEYTKKIIEIAKEEKIPYQIDVEPGNSGTDAWAAQVSKNGILTILVSIPIKYMHTPIEVMKIDDIKLTVKLITRFLIKLSEIAL